MDPWQWALAALCALMVGMAKTGVPGLGILVVPLMAMVCANDTGRSAGILLPLLCLADCFAVFYYRRHASVWRLWDLIPWVAIGMALAWLVMTGAELYHLKAALRPIVGAIVLLMVGAHLLRTWRGDPTPERNWHRAALFGITAGFATTLANAAGPVMNLYLLSQALAKDEFMGTGAWFFFVINLSKIPIYLTQKTPWIDGAGLRIDALLALPVLIGALTGRWIYAHLPQRAFEIAVLTLTTLAAIILLVR
jgi:uncharacterized membrane protein YfcA